MTRWLIAVFASFCSMVEQKVAPGSLDHCLSTVLPVLMNELTGPVGAEKDVEAIRNQSKEAKNRKAPECFQLLARVIDFSK